MDGAPSEDVRTQARELALKMLYAIDVGRPSATDEEMRSIAAMEGPATESIDFARMLVNGIAEHKETLDDAIQQAAVNWQVSRMPYVDRALLRIGVFELLYVFDVPPRVSINEAVELAKKYSTEKSGSFVNGVLDKIFQTHCPQKA